MRPGSTASSCPICGEEQPGEAVICEDCQKAFNNSEEAGAPGEGIDLDRYIGKMFPWEPSKVAPGLIWRHRSAMLLCLGLVLIVVLLALLRAPIPSCWEVG